MTHLDYMTLHAVHGLLVKLGFLENATAIKKIMREERVTEETVVRLRTAAEVVAANGYLESAEVVMAACERLRAA